jgi:hypothetical protein
MPHFFVLPLEFGIGRDDLRGCAQSQQLFKLEKFVFCNQFISLSLSLQSLSPEEQQSLVDARLLGSYSRYLFFLTALVQPISNGSHTEQCYHRSNDYNRRNFLLKHPEQDHIYESNNNHWPTMITRW